MVHKQKFGKCVKLPLFSNSLTYIKDLHHVYIIMWQSQAEIEDYSVLDRLWAIDANWRRIRNVRYR
jgi:hypothetical protein